MRCAGGGAAELDHTPGRTTSTVPARSTGSSWGESGGPGESLTFGSGSFSFPDKTRRSIALIRTIPDMKNRRMVNNPPDPNALRRNRPADQASWTRLPNTGLQEVPDWPDVIEDKPSMPELALWNQMWRDFPQAHIWKRDRCEIQVAIYVRTALFAASRDARATYLTAVRQQSEHLLLTPLSLRAARCVIDGEIEAQVDEDTGQPLALVQPLNRPSARDRAGGIAAPVLPEDDEATDDDEDDEPRESDDE